MKQCTACLEDKPISGFYRRSGRSGHYATCKSCFNIGTVERQREHKERAVKMFGGCCSKCGYDRCIGALEFHHVDRSLKEHINGKLWSRSWPRVLAELEKCVLVCANCHREIENSLVV